MDGHPKQVSFETMSKSTSKSIRKSPRKNSVRIGANQAIRGIHTPCLRCDLSQDADQLKAFFERIFREALAVVTESKKLASNLNSEQLKSMVVCFDFWFNQLFFLQSAAEWFVKVFEKHTFMLNSLRSILATNKAACLHQGVKLCPELYFFCNSFQFRVERINNLNKRKKKIESKEK